MSESDKIHLVGDDLIIKHSETVMIGMSDSNGLYTYVAMPECREGVMEMMAVAARCIAMMVHRIVESGHACEHKEHILAAFLVQLNEAMTGEEDTELKDFVSIFKH